MKRAFFLISILLLLTLSLLAYFQANNKVRSDAHDFSLNICNWLSQEISLNILPVGDKTRIQLQSIKERYGPDFQCRVQKSNFNTSHFETSVFVSSDNKDLIGLRFGLQTNLYKLKVSTSFLGYWTPR